MIKTNRIIAFLIAAGVGLSATAQTQLPPKVEVFMPKTVAQNIVRLSDLKELSKDWGQKNITNMKHWVVYSDRDSNPTYNGPSKSSGEFTKLKFNETLRIADIKNGFALVYYEPMNGIAAPKISTNAVSKGWIPMENLLLWHSCPVNEKDIYQKALLVANLDKTVTDGMGYRYSNPVSQEGKQKVVTDMSFYYVMKTDPTTGLQLLSHQAKLDGASDQVLYGWVDNNSYTPWNQRSCLEPNWDPEAVQYLNNPVGKKFQVYHDADLKQVASYYQYGVANKNDKNPNTRFRLDPYQTRFPILDNDSKNDNVFKCTTFGGGGRSLNGEDAEMTANDLRAVQEYTNKLQNINLIFVIDGTKSMKPYFASVKNAIKKSLDYFDTHKYNIRVGVVIYRDYADGEALTEVQPLVRYNDVRLGKFIDEIGNLGYGASSAPGDHTHTEALFKGIEKALDAKSLGYTPEQENMMMVIGDCGNDLADTQALSQEELIQKLAANKIQLMSFQVRSTSAEPWQLFNSQMSKLIKNNMDIQYGKLGAKVRFKGSQHGYDINNGDGKQFFVGSMRFEEEGKDMDVNQLSALITANIGNFSKAVQTQIDLLQKTSNEGGFIGGGVEQNSQMDEEFVVSIIGRERYERMKKSKVAMSVTGFAPRKDRSGREFWKPIVFLSTAELDNLLERLVPVYDRAQEVKESDNRKPYVDAVKGLLRAMVPDITDAEMDQKGLDEVMNMISGLNVTSDALSYSLLDLQDIHKVRKETFQSLVNDFCDKYERLRRIRKSNYTYSYVQNDTRYYWIPVDDLP